MAKGCWAIANLKKYANLQTLRQVYFALVYPHLQYAITCWGSAAKCHLNKLITKQKWAVKLITNSSKETPSNPLFIQLKLLKLEDIFKLKTALEIKRINSLNLSNNSGLQLISSIHNYKTRSSTKHEFHIPQVNSNVGKSSLKFQGPTIWNKIPLELRNKPLQTFKFKYKNYLIKQYDLNS